MMRKLTEKELEKIKEELLYHAYDKMAEIYCSKLLGLEVVDEKGYDLKDPKTGERYQVKSRINKPTDSTSFDNIKVGEFDWLLCVFLNERCEITDIFKVAHDFVESHLSADNRFRWNRKIRSDPNVVKL